MTPDFKIKWKVADDNVGMSVARRANEIPASAFQAVNPIYILLFGLAFSALWTFLGTHGLEPSTPFKFALGLLQLGLGFVALWYGARVADARGMVGVEWLLLAYLLHTTGELCLSPVGLVDDYQALARPPGEHGDGRLVPHDRDCSVPRRHHRPVHARRRQRGSGCRDSAPLRHRPYLRQRLRHHRHRRRRRRAALFLPRAVAETMDARRRGSPLA